MVFNEQTVPTVIVKHQCLPLVEDLLDLISIPVSESQAEAGLVVVDVYHLENKDHVEFATLGADYLEDLFLIAHEGHLADRDGVVLAEHFTVHRLQPFVQAWAVSVPFVTRLVFASRRGDRGIWVAWGLGDVVDDIHAESACASLQPKVEDIMHSSAHIRILPVQIGLLWSEQRKIVLLRFLVPSPGAVGFA